MIILIFLAFGDDERLPSLVHPLREAEQRQVSHEVRHAGRPRAAQVHRDARNSQDQENGVRRQAQVPALRKQVKYFDPWK